MRIAVMGAGGVGGYFGGLLARAGEDVTFIARGAHLDAIRRNGLRLASDLSGVFTVRSEATEDTSSVGPVDLVLYAVKMYHNEEAISAVAPMVGPNTVVLTLQNGIDNGDKLALALGKSHVMIGAAFVQARIQEPGVVAQLGRFGRVVFGEMEGGKTPRGDRLLGVFHNARWNVELTDNAQGAVWQKFVFLVGSAGVNAASNATYGEMRTAPATRELLRGAFQEVVALAEAKGIAIDENALESSMGLLDGFPADGRASLANDFINGNPTELEGLTGTVVRLGREMGVPTPINTTIYALLEPAGIRIASARGGG